MTPSVPDVLLELAGLLVRNAAPDVPSSERASNLSLSAALLGILAETWDGQATILVEENRALRTLLGQEGIDADLRLSALQSENDRLRAALITLHVGAETARDTAMQVRIWAELAASTQRRKLSTSPV